MVEEVRYDSAFTFNLSPRRATLAADLPDQLPHEVKRERMERLSDAVQRIARSGRSGSSGAAWRCWWRASHARISSAPRADAAQQDGQLHRPSAAGELTRVDIASATSTTLAGAEALG